MPLDHEGLPGRDLILDGLADLREGRETVCSLLVSIGAPRLRGIGIEVPNPFEGPEHRLYALLAAEDSDGAHASYNALIRRLVSFERAAESVSGQPWVSARARSWPGPPRGP